MCHDISESDAVLPLALITPLKCCLHIHPKQNIYHKNYITISFYFHLWHRQIVWQT